jgi:hypothetical protein
MPSPFTTQQIQAMDPRCASVCLQIAAGRIKVWEDGDSQEAAITLPYVPGMPGWRWRWRDLIDPYSPTPPGAPINICDDSETAEPIREWCITESGYQTGEEEMSPEELVFEALIYWNTAQGN